MAVVRPAPIPSGWDSIAVRSGVPREELPEFQKVYSVVYYAPDVIAKTPALTQLRDITFGKVDPLPHLKFHCTYKPVTPYPRNIRNRDPLEVAWNFLRDEIINRPSFYEQYERFEAPKWVAPEETTDTDGWVPLRNEAPVWCAMKGLGTCKAKYALVVPVRPNGSHFIWFPYLAVTPIDPTNNESDGVRERAGPFRSGSWWKVPMNTCLPLKLAVQSWPNPNRPLTVNPDDVYMLREDGCQEILPINYVLSATQQSDLPVMMARECFRRDYPSAAAVANMAPIVPPSPQRQEALKGYTLVRYMPEEQAKEERAKEQALQEEEQESEEEADPKDVNGTTTTTPDGTVPAAANNQVRLTGRQLYGW